MDRSSEGAHFMSFKTCDHLISILVFVFRIGLNLSVYLLANLYLNPYLNCTILKGKPLERSLGTF